mgnify:CR=1 FL=1
MEDVKEKRVWLLVEDDTLIRMMLSTLLSTWDIVPLAFDDGYKTMAWLEQVEKGKANRPLPELALLDIRMPGPGGTDIARRLRQVQATSNIAIIMMTAYRFDPAERQMFDDEVQPDQFINKPLPPPSKLKEMMETALVNRRKKGPEAKKEEANVEAPAKEKAKPAGAEKEAAKPEAMQPESAPGKPPVIKEPASKTEDAPKVEKKP